jgi:hypothetical protein
MWMLILLLVMLMLLLLLLFLMLFFATAYASVAVQFRCLFGAVGGDAPATIVVSNVVAYAVDFAGNVVAVVCTRASAYDIFCFKFKTRSLPHVP